jgi:hypothetical protein
MSTDDSGIFHKGEEFQKLFDRASEFTRDLMEANQQLRGKLLEVQQKQNQAAQNPGDWEALRQDLTTQIHSLEEEKTDALDRLREAEEENRHFAERYVEIEEENNNLANLYVASFQLHATLDSEEVLQTIQEIVINLVGAEIFAVYDFTEPTGRLKAVASEGREVDAFPDFALGQGIVGSSVEAGETFCGENAYSEDLAEPVVSIPLCVQDKPLGAIAIYKLLEQKEQFTTLDHELFSLLGGHAATAILASRLFTQSERKANTMQGFLGLLTERGAS